VSEHQAKYQLAGTQMAINAEKNVPTQQEILDHQEYKEYHKALTDCKVGTQSHLLFGHGKEQAAFENRDIGTVNDSVFDKLQKTQKYIDPHHNMDGREGKTLNKF